MPMRGAGASIAFSIAIAWATTLQANEPAPNAIYATYWREMCSHERTDMPNDVQGLSCTFYLAGFMDALQTTAEFKRNIKIFCPSRTFTIETMRYTFLKYESEVNPKGSSDGFGQHCGIMGDQLLIALHKDFPCPKI